MATRPTRYAGTWYPADASSLHCLLEDACQAARATIAASRSPRTLTAALLPHAGLVYSAKMIMANLAELRDHSRPLRVVILAPSHYLPLDADHLYTAALSGFETPLGSLKAWPVAQTGSPWENNQPAIQQEHAIEMFLPCLAFLSPDCSILPVLVPEITSLANLETLADSIRRQIASTSDRTVIIASSDMTHYGQRFKDELWGPHYKDSATQVRQRDLAALDQLAQKDPAGFFNSQTVLAPTMCGRNPALLLSAVAHREGWEGSVTGYYNSVEAMDVPSRSWPQSVQDSRATDFVSYAGLAYRAKQESHGTD